MKNTLLSITNSNMFKILFSCLGFVFVVAFVSINAHASSFDTSLPYIVDDELEYPIEDFENLYFNFIDENFGGFDLFDTNWSDNIIVFKIIDGNVIDYEVFVPRSNFTGYTVDLNGVPYADFDISSNQLNITGNVLQITFYHYLNDGRFVFYGVNEYGYNIQLLGNFNQLAYISNNIMWGDFPVLQVYGQPTGSVVGTTIAPNFGAGAGTGGSDFLGSGADFGGSVANATMPNSPVYNTYNFTTYNPPIFDDSSMLNALFSIYDILVYTGEYLVTNIVGAITTLMQNIQSAIAYIGDLIKYCLRTLITNIQNGFQNLFENIQSLFEPLLNSISEKIDYITQPVDSDTIVSGITGSGIATSISDVKDFYSGFDEIFDIVEPDTFIIEIDLSELDYFDSGLLDFNLPTFYLNLGDNIKPFRNALRTFLWVVCSVGVIFFIEKNLPSMLMGSENGGGSKND